MLAAPLRAFEADQVLVDAPDLDQRVRAAIAGGALPGGRRDDRELRCAERTGVCGNARVAVFRDDILRGFWLRRWLMQTPPECVAALFRELAAKVTDGTLAVDVEAFYPIRRIKEALAHAACSGRSGKILVTFAEG
jgi:trans-2-enoyl-CoA reductase